MKNYNILQKTLNWNLQYKKQKYRTIKGYCIKNKNVIKISNSNTTLYTIYLNYLQILFNSFNFPTIYFEIAIQFLIIAERTLNDLAAESWKVPLSIGIVILLLLLTAKITDV